MITTRLFYELHIIIIILIKEQLDIIGHVFLLDLQRVQEGYHNKSVTG